ncbi:MAG: RNA polymerase sigma factor [Gaiellaceae bacterium]
MQPPPFEHLYREHAVAVLALLRRKLGRERAEDAFQETFLRALRAYPRLRHADNLAGWLKTIASNVATDELRRRKDAPLGSEEPQAVAPPSGEKLTDLTRSLPRAQRTAVVLRYAFDLDYETIGGVLGSSPEAACQAASTGVRRLREETA